EMLMGIRRRCLELGIPFPLMITVDNCCQVAKDILKAFPEIQICLDVYHFMMRYLAAVLNGMNNPHRGELAADIRNAVLKNSASKGVLAQYWEKDEQEANMIAVYNKYTARGGVWSAAAHTVHTAQLKHLHKGCLSRRDQTVASDGSRIEGSHKGWNSIQRASASGLELQTALSHDFVLRRNIRVACGKTAGDISNLDDFLRTTFGSHHSRLVSHTASLLNDIIHTEATRRKASPSNELLRPVLKSVASGETFGLVKSEHNDTFGGLLTIKDENSDEDQLFNEALESSVNPEEILGDLNIDPALLLQPLHITVPPMEPDAVHILFSHFLVLTRVQKGVKASVTVPSLEPDVVRISSPRPFLFLLTQTKNQQHVGNEARTAASGKRKEPDTPSIPFPDGGSHTSADGNVDKMVHSFFNMSKTAKPHGTAVTGLTNLLPLPTPSDSTTSRLMRSEALFAQLTGVNPKSLEIGRGPEFFLFVDMRSELGWKSSDMTSRRWFEATALYNERLGNSGVHKRPRALSDKLGELERVCLNHIATNTFKSQRGDDKFWRKHCFIVPLIKKGEFILPRLTRLRQARAVATCKRCNKIMYPGPKKSPENHKKGYCSDGFKQKTAEDESASWPQPAGLFTAGSEFHPLQFLITIREVYETVVVKADNNVSMEQEAFLSMLPGRIIISDSAVLFKLFAGFTIPADDGTPENLFVELNGAKYLRIDALREGDLSITLSSA
ncbi:hypothetical protein C8F04DRAFT_966119, partial [Mycena alexandri]